MTYQAKFLAPVKYGRKHVVRHIWIWGDSTRSCTGLHILDPAPEGRFASAELVKAWLLQGSWNGQGGSG